MDPITLAMLGLQGYKFLEGVGQRAEANSLQLRDTTPPAFTEALQLGRQGAAAGLPGAGTELNRINAATSDTLAAATQAGTSGQSVLSLLGIADANKQQALAGLMTRTDANQQQQNRNLTGLLDKEASYQKADQDALDKSRAALRESGARNIYGALDGATQVGAYALKKDEATTPGSLNSPLIKKAGRKVAAASGPEVSGPDDILSAQRKLYGSLGVPTYGLYGLG